MLYHAHLNITLYVGSTPFLILMVDKMYGMWLMANFDSKFAVLIGSTKPTEPMSVL